MRAKLRVSCAVMWRSSPTPQEPSLTPEMQFDFFTRIFEPVEEDRKSEKDETEVKVTEREEGAESPTQEGREEGDVEEAGVPPQREEEPTEVCHCSLPYYRAHGAWEILV